MLITLITLLVCILLITSIAIWDHYLYKQELNKTKKGGVVFQDKPNKIKGFIDIKPVVIVCGILFFIISFVDNFMGFNLKKDVHVINKKEVIKSRVYFYPLLSYRHEFQGLNKCFSYTTDSLSEYFTKDSFNIDFNISASYNLKDSGYIFFAKNNITDSSYKEFEKNIILPKLKQEMFSLFLKHKKNQFENYPNTIMFLLRKILSDHPLFEINELYISNIHFSNKEVSIKKEFIIEVKNEELLDKKIKVQNKLNELKQLQIKTFQQKILLDSILNHKDSLIFN